MLHLANYAWIAKAWYHIWCLAGVEVLQQQYKTIATRLEAQVVAAYLYQTKAITFKDLQKIQSLRDIPVQAAETLLEIILEQPVAIYQCFLDVLKDKQNHIYEQLLKDSYEGWYVTATIFNQV